MRVISFVRKSQLCGLPEFHVSVMAYYRGWIDRELGKVVHGTMSQPITIRVATDRQLVIRTMKDFHI